MGSTRALRFYCDESGTTGTHWLDSSQPTLVHGGWLFTEDAEREVLTGLDGIRRRHRLNAPELKWTQFARPGRAGAFREVVELCLSNGVIPMFMVMDKKYAIAAKVVETFFDPLYNHHLPTGFTGDFESKKGLTEATMLAPALSAIFAPWLRSGARPAPSGVRALARALAEHLASAGIPSFASTLTDLTDDAINELSIEFEAEAMLRSTTWTMTWAMVSLVLQFVNTRGLTVEFFQDQITRFDQLVEIVKNQPGVTDFQLVDSKSYLGVQLADLLCGFVRTVFTNLTAGHDLTAEERATCGDLLMLKQEFEAWNGNLPEHAWMSFTRISWLELRRRFATT